MFTPHSPEGVPEADKYTGRLVFLLIMSAMLISKAIRNGTCQRVITQFYLPPTRLSTNGLNHPAFIPGRRASPHLFRPVLISRLAEGRRLSWPGMQI